MDKFFSCKKMKKNFSQRLYDFMNRSFITQCSLAGVVHAGMTKGEQLDNVGLILGINQRTVRRWFECNNPHPSAVRLLFTLYDGVPLGDGWADWRFNGGYLVSPNGYAFPPDVDLHMQHLKNEIAILRGKLADRQIQNQAGASSVAVRHAIKALMRAFSINKTEI